MMTKILLVEDNELNRDMLTRRLTKRGYRVAAAVDACEALEMVKADRPDVILMDLELLPACGKQPGPDGWQTTRTLKAMPETRDIPVIALSAHAMAEHRDKSLAAGCDDFDVKPVDLARLLGKIQALLQRKAQV